MKTAPYLKLTVLGIALLGVGQAMADDLPLPTDPAQQREKMRGMTAEERSAQREQMQALSRHDARGTTTHAVKPVPTGAPA
ncbi:MAG: hypothetical protein IPF55_04320 [Rhodoferax sp.]|nr:hypothetical protein [Rhodoferax sp.]